MSKVLRRPMFRGGRVDSRGTGITTGLDRPGMQGGGMPPSGSTFNINMGARTPPPTSSPIFRPPAVIQPTPTVTPQGITYRGIFDALKSGGRGMLSRLAPFNPFSAAGVTMALPFLPSYIMAQANKPKTIEALEYMKSMNQSGIMDETAAPDDVTAYYAELDRLNKEGTPLGTEITLESGETITPGLTTGKETLATVIDLSLIHI